MKVNMFKDTKIWSKLEEHNKIVIDTYNRYKTSITTSWFNPEYIKRGGKKGLWCRKSDKPGTFYINDFVSPNDWNLVMHPNNYLPIFLINLLYEDNKDIVIEDVCCGMGTFSYYLSLLGFNKFSLFDNFTGVNVELLDNMMLKNNISYTINQQQVMPTVSNMSAYPWYTSPMTMGIPLSETGGGWDETDTEPKTNIPIDTCELFVFYCAKNIFETIGKYLLNNGYVELCQDEDCITVAYCKKEKYDEFIKKVGAYAI